MTQADGVFDVRVRNVEHMIINERKFRVKLTLLFTVRLFSEKELQFFEGLKDEELQMKEEKTCLTALALVKKDEVSLDEAFSGKDPALKPKYILKQNFSVVENYRQITTEKVVINGFVFCSLLYSAENSAGEESTTVLCQHNQRIEFTQFVPLEKENRSRAWNSVRTAFNCDGMSAVIEQDEENGERAGFRVKGAVQTRVELYERRERTMITDAYHREKHLTATLHESGYRASPIRYRRKSLCGRSLRFLKGQRHRMPYIAAPEFWPAGASAKRGKLR